MWKPGVWELVIVLVIVLLVVGPGRVSKLGKDLGQGISEFRKGIATDENKDEEEANEF